MTSNPSQPPAAVLLPRPSQSNPTAEPVWTVNNVLPPVRKQQSEGILGEVPPLQSRCAAHDREGDKCCKELKGDDERHLISPEIVRDIYVTRRCNSNVKADQACDVESSVFPTSHCPLRSYRWSLFYRFIQTCRYRWSRRAVCRSHQYGPGRLLYVHISSLFFLFR